jgi:hypothetical protein
MFLLMSSLVCCGPQVAMAAPPNIFRRPSILAFFEEGMENLCEGSDMDHSRRSSSYQSRHSVPSWKNGHCHAGEPSYTGPCIHLKQTDTTMQSRTPSGAHSVPQPAKSNVKWKSLFNFTTRKHTLVIIFSAVFAILVGAVTPVQSYLLGRVFGNFAKYAGGTVSESQFKHDMLVYNLYFVGLGTISWVFTTLYFAGWVLFGELQARSARGRLFKALLDRKIEWFDQRKDGMGAMTTKLQRRVN